jgi:hypothetical protein
MLYTNELAVVTLYAKPIQTKGVMGRASLRNGLVKHVIQNVSFYRGHILINVSSGEGRICTPPEADQPMA